MKHIVACIFLGVILSSNIMHAQVVADTFYVPNYPIPEIYYSDGAPELPENVWNHKLKYFPDSIVEQNGPTCGQCAGIFNCMTYMFNRAYDRKSNYNNTFPANYTFNILSRDVGVSTFESWNIMMSQGHPFLTDYECVNDTLTYKNLSYYERRQYWMNGYDKYLSSFSNKISGYFSLNLNNEIDLKILQHFLNDRFENSKDGGVAIFYSNPLVYSPIFSTIQDSSLFFGNIPCNNEIRVTDTIINQHLPTHCMTIVGYYKNDSVDFNNDGLITDTIDINNDGKIDFHDNETTLWIITNSSGVLEPIFLLKYDAIQYIWNKQVFFPIVDTCYTPEITLKFKMQHDNRKSLKLELGISSDLNSKIPEKVIDFPVFNFQGGDFPLTGLNNIDSSNILEFGVDITEIKKHINQDGNYKVFIKVIDENIDNSKVLFLSLIDYRNQNIEEIIFVDSTSTLNLSSETVFETTLNISKTDNNQLYIKEKSLTCKSNSINQFLITPINGVSPFTYFIVNKNEYSSSLTYEQYPSDLGYTISGGLNPLVIDPEWDILFEGKKWDSISIEHIGVLRFHSYPYPWQESYPYEYGRIKTNFIEIMPRSIHDYFEWGDFYMKLSRYQLTENSLKYFFKRKVYINSEIVEEDLFYFQLNSDGTIKIIYPSSINKYHAIIKTNTCDYFIPYEHALSDTFNTVTFTPNPADSLFTIDENGVLTMQAVSEPGKYETYVLVRDADGQEFTKRIEVNVINENIIGKLYPNPTKDILYCDIYNPYNQNATIEVFTISGQCVYKQTELLPAGIVEHNFNTEQYGQGVYLLKISMGDNSQNQRFVVTK